MQFRAVQGHMHTTQSNSQQLGRVQTLDQYFADVIKELKSNLSGRVQVKHVAKREQCHLEQHLVLNRLKLQYFD